MNNYWDVAATFSNNSVQFSLLAVIDMDYCLFIYLFFSFQSYMEDHLNNKDRLNKEWEVIIFICISLHNMYCSSQRQVTPSHEIIVRVFWGD